MGMPMDLVMVRHGQSEANIVQQADKEGRADELPIELRVRPDWQHRLTDLGVRQAINAGDWIRREIGPIESFRGRHSSPYIRARQSAAYIGGLDLAWQTHPMLHERDWGHYGRTPRGQQEKRFPETVRMHRDSPLYARFDGGEALADSVTMRIRDYRDTLMRKYDGERVIAVVHGDVMGVARYVFEQLRPEQWEAIDRDPTQRLGNCALLWLSRRDPEDPERVLPYLGWRRIVNTWEPDPARSPYNGEWRELPDNRFMTGAEMLALAEQYPRLLPPEGIA